RRMVAAVGRSNSLRIQEAIANLLGRLECLGIHDGKDAVTRSSGIARRWDNEYRENWQNGKAGALAKPLRGVELRAAGVAKDLFGVMRADAAAGKDFDAASRGGHKLGDLAAPFASRRRAAARQDAFESQVDEFFKSRHAVGDFVKSPMEDDLAAGQLRKLRTAAAINSAFGHQGATDDPGRTLFQEPFGIALERGELARGVNEVAGPRADE